MKIWVLLLACLSVSNLALADAPEIKSVQIERGDDGKARVAVTLEHPDAGWDHYADAWRIEDADGNVLAKRVLAHPHVDEQPFTRDLSGVNLPENGEFFVRAKCSRDGWAK